MKLHRPRAFAFCLVLKHAVPTTPEMPAPINKNNRE